MSEQIKHECGIAMVRLRKPPAFYREKYGRTNYGLDLLYLLMEKQHNRGQEGAGVACIKLDARPGSEYIFRERAMGSGAIGEVFAGIHAGVREAAAAGVPEEEYPFHGEVYIGHLRYSTTGRSGISYTHPFLRRNNWRIRNLCLAGNFNLTNVDEVFDIIVSRGQHPRHNADTFIILEQLGYLLDAQVQQLRDRFKAEEGLMGEELNARIESELDMETVVRRASATWDGGFVICGSTGSGDAFVFRDRWGIRPAFWYCDDEIVVAASERAVIQTVLDVETDRVCELRAGEGMFIDPAGEVTLAQVLDPAQPTRPCSFERIYFSRGSDRDIYRERKALGRLLVPSILDSVDYDLDHTVFSFIPNTAEVAYYGMVEGLNDYLNGRKASAIAALPQATPPAVEEILSHTVRTEKLAVKDIKLRTFIAENDSRNDLAAHVYDITYGTVEAGVDSIVVIDDSIVRGTTLRQSIVKILGRLDPVDIVIVSSSPQVRYPDCYGIDMSRMGEFIAFNAAVDLLRESGRQEVIEAVYRKCKAQEDLPKEQVVNHVKEIYAPFTDREISERIARLVTPEGCRCGVKVVYQTIEGLHKACPGHSGDWYFSGDYPTPGGNRLVNRAYINWYEGRRQER
ncbi:MAG: amidophosphoribosyltransferase [Rikenellaceae bacterium]|nr:amidophosphoribosyltransferase [Rikenellaceae bacterium]